MGMWQRVIENLFRKPATRNFPEECVHPAAGQRGHIEFNADTCKFCNACALACPANAIEVDKKSKTLTFEPFRCVTCGACVDACKFGSVATSEAFRCPQTGKTVEVYQKAIEPKEPKEAEESTDARQPAVDKAASD